MKRILLVLLAGCSHNGQPTDQISVSRKPSSIIAPVSGEQHVFAVRESWQINFCRQSSPATTYILRNDGSRSILANSQTKMVKGAAPAAFQRFRALLSQWKSQDCKPLTESSPKFWLEVHQGPYSWKIDESAGELYQAALPLDPISES